MSVMVLAGIPGRLPPAHGATEIEGLSMFTLVLDTVAIEREAERRSLTAGQVLSERLREVANYAAANIRILPVTDEWNHETHTVAPGVAFDLTAASTNP